MIWHGVSFSFQMFVSRITAYFRRKCVTTTDDRVQKMNEVLTYIKFIKMYAWVKAFSQSVQSKCTDFLRVHGRRTLASLLPKHISYQESPCRRSIIYILIIRFYELNIDRDVRDLNLWLISEMRKFRPEKIVIFFFFFTPKITQLVMSDSFSCKDPYLYLPCP